jgi:hypothetical protein
MIDHVRRTAATAVLVLSAMTLGACEPEPDDTAMTEGLLLLSGEVGDVTLEVRDSDDPTGRDIELPDPATTWVSAGRTNVLLATLVDGRTFVSNPLGDDEPEWRLVEALTVDDRPPDPPLYFGAWDPPGGAYVQLGADFAGGGGLRVVVVDPALQGATEAALDDSRPLPAPPAWVDDDRVVVVTAAADATETIVVDTTSGEPAQGPGPARLVTTSADASTAALWRGPGDPIEVLATDDWLDGRNASIRIEPPESGWTPAVLALDGTGRRLAVVWSDEDGSPAGATVHAAAREWAEVASIGLDEVQAATVAWLR